MSKQQSTPFFSVIVPIYNRITFIDSGITCLLNQSFSDYEVILIDDGSTDGSAAVCDEIARNEKITTIHKENGGPGSARNAGLERARGVYVCFFDIDDHVSDDWLEKVYRHLSDKKLELLVYGYRECNPILGTVSEFLFDDSIYLTNEALRASYSVSLSGIRFNNGFVWNKVYKRDFLTHNDIRFPNLSIQQDEVFNHAVYKKVERSSTISEIMYDYYVYNEGTGRFATITDRTAIFTSVRNSFLNLYDFWRLDDAKLLTYIHGRFIQSILYNRNKVGLRGACAYADEIFATKEVEESVAYLGSDRVAADKSIDRLYRIAIKKRSKLLWLLADLKEWMIRKAKNAYRSVVPRRPFANK